MKPPAHVFVTWIRTSPERLWRALTSPDWTVRYFHATRFESELKRGAPVYYRYAHDGSVAVEGEVLEIEPEERLSITWHVLYDEEESRERPSRVTFEIEPSGPDLCKLTVVHDDFDGETKTYRGVGEGWPWILHSLKSLLETGEPLPPPQRD
jgi:uncharacterized protein YndB with AHSA1/START domain